MRPLGILWALLTLLIAVAVGVGAYQYGLHDGLSQQIQNLSANTVPAPGYGYPYYGHFGWGYGFPFFPLFPLLPLFGFLFFLLIFFAVFRFAMFGPRRWHGGPRGHRPGGHLEEWHRQAHAGDAAQAPPTQ